VAADPRLIEFARQMRRKPTPAEEAMWRELRGRQFLGFKFRRQHPLGLYIADFYTSSVALVVEIDGEKHVTAEELEYDCVRHQYLRSLELEVIRFWNAEVHDNLEGVLETLEQTCKNRLGRTRRRTPAHHRRERTIDPVMRGTPPHPE
jgi:very-short-patch-repair endonuclease